MSSAPKYLASDGAIRQLAPTASEASQPPPLARDLMTRDVATCHAGDTLEHCARLMWDRGCGCVVVVEDVHRPVAVITDRDVCMAAYTQGRPLAEMVVASAMSRRLFVVDERAPLEDAERLMRLHCIRRLPVIDRSGALLGLLSIADIATNAPTGPTLGRDGLDSKVITATVAALHHSVRPPAL